MSKKDLLRDLPIPLYAVNAPGLVVTTYDVFRINKLFNNSVIMQLLIAKAREFGNFCNALSFIHAMPSNDILPSDISRQIAFYLVRLGLEPIPLYMSNIVPYAKA